ncbi:hypothetical protein AB1Y20_013403 [Prymnesium parvum]|uniref:CS domain-containing protein n=1 Tax=Prymnesium parvum TaxID=97485 RepID=A0AB34IFA7_PRYPA
MYTFSQTRPDLSLHLRLPEGTRPRDVSCELARGSLCVRSAASSEPLLVGELFDEAAHSAWFVDGGVFTLEIEKKKARFWPSALKGGPQVDVRELERQEKKDKAPVYRPQQDPESTPVRVTDREALLKLKAEFPELAIPIDSPHTAKHKPYAGPRKPDPFSWGEIPATLPAAPAAAAAPPPCDSPADSAAFSWGALPAPAEAARPPAAASSPSPAFHWGPLPSAPIPPSRATPAAKPGPLPSGAVAPLAAPTASVRTAASDSAPSVASEADPVDAPRYSWGPIPGGK